MSHDIIQISDDFWNIRGAFKVLGLLDVQTQCSLVRLPSGAFVMLDSYGLEDEVRERVLALTDGGKAVQAVVNLHPFHTLHVSAARTMFPDAKFYGTKRHHSECGDIGWEPEHPEDDGFGDRFESAFEFHVPAGVQLVTDDPHVHFSSVLAIHRPSGTLHVDDTLSWLPLPWGGRLHWHPTLGKALEPGPDAAGAFRRWAGLLAERCHDVKTVCTAHARMSDLQGEAPGVVAEKIRLATSRIEWKLRRHAG
ncbi:MAG: hypothetical protein ACE37F_21105 [Nannocystaceae bacterium]|nr:hypothetical protein [bacterium]